MKMKRSVILSLFAVTLTALCATTAQATVNVQLNLRYTNPALAADPNFGCIHGQSCAATGGTWQLLVQSTATNGIAGIRFVIEGMSGVIGVNNGDINGNDQVWTDPNDPSVFNFNFVSPLDPNDGSVEIVAGDDLNGPLLLFVGRGSGTPGNRAEDDLNNSFWDNSALIASGFFDGHFHDIILGGTVPLIPSIVSVEANEFGADPNTIFLATIGTVLTRGDSWVGLGLEDPSGAGLLKGDTDRDFDVDIADLGALAGSLGVETGAIWGPGEDAGDTDGDGDVDIADLGALAGNLGLTGGLPPAISAVPEPTSIALTLLGLTAFAFPPRRRVSG